jgi:serine/threonine protein kinase
MTSYYASIEQLEREIPHLSMDIWSLGIIAYKLMAKKEPYMQLSDLKR